MFVTGDDPQLLLNLLCLTNSAPFLALINLHLARGQLARSYEVGIIQQTPVPSLEGPAKRLSQLALTAHDLTRSFARSQEATRAFCLPTLVQDRGELLSSRLNPARNEVTAAQIRLIAIQAEVDRIITGLYGLRVSDLVFAWEEVAGLQQAEIESVVEEDTESDSGLDTADSRSTVEDLVMWCLGSAFGRWDVRFAIDPTLLPKLQGPFDPLPRCSPGMLVGPDGLPAHSGSIVSKEWLRARPNVITFPDTSTLDVSRSTPNAPRSTIPDSAYPLEEPPQSADLLAPPIGKKELWPVALLSPA